MSLFAAMSAAVTGLGAQARKMGHISDNIANVSTIGYKKIGTNFSTLVTQSDHRTHSPGGVISTPSYYVNLQGQIQSSAKPTHIAVNGDGFFIVRNYPDETSTQALNRQFFYTRRGDFSFDAEGNMVNSAGYYLQGRAYDRLTGDILPGDLQTVSVKNMGGLAQRTSDIRIGANLPADSRVANITAAVPETVDFIDDGSNTLDAVSVNAQTYSITINGRTVTATGDGVTTVGALLDTAIGTFADGTTASWNGGTGTLQISGPSSGAALIINAGNTGAAESLRVLGQELIGLGESDQFTEQTIYDEQGQAHTVRTEYIKTAQNEWTIRLLERNTGGNWMQINDPVAQPIVANFNVDGTLTSITGGSGADVNFVPDMALVAGTDPAWQWGSEAITINFGKLGATEGLTQYSSEFAVTDLVQNGLPYGQFTGVNIDEYGDVFANYGNGASVRIYNLPLAAFANPEGLQNVDGNAYRPNAFSGDASILQPGVGRAGKVISEALEGSNVDIAEEFTQMIQTQRAYSANSRVITTADEMTDEILRIKR